MPDLSAKDEFAIQLQVQLSYSHVVVHSMSVVVPDADCCQFDPVGKGDCDGYFFSLGELGLDVLISSEEFLFEQTLEELLALHACTGHAHWPHLPPTVVE